MNLSSLTNALMLHLQVARGALPTRSRGVRRARRSFPAASRTPFLAIPECALRQTWKSRNQGATQATHRWRNIPRHSGQRYFLPCVWHWRRNARFLSDMPGETDFLEWIGDEATIAKSKALRGIRARCSPVLADLPVATILRLRKQERDAFEAYRKAIEAISANIMSAEGRIFEKEAREMFRAAIEPELHRMQREMTSYRKSQGRRVMSGVASIVARGSDRSISASEAASFGTFGWRGFDRRNTVAGQGSRIGM